LQRLVEDGAKGAVADIGRDELRAMAKAVPSRPWFGGIVDGGTTAL